MLQQACKGHTGMVLCMHTFGGASSSSTRNEHVLLSGSEDATVRVWDVRVCKSVRRLQAPEAVASICALREDGDVFWIASGRGVYCFDLRMDSRVLVSFDLAHLTFPMEDEINVLAQSANRTIVAGDDSGCISFGPKKTKKAHESVVTCMQFLSDSLLVSGSFDQTVCISSISDASFAPPTRKNCKIKEATQYNPPHIFDIALCPREDDLIRSFACAMGDGSVAICEPSRHSKPTKGSVQHKVNWDAVFADTIIADDIHRAGTCCVQFASESVLVSASTDKTLAFLDYARGESLRFKSGFVLEHKPNALLHSPACMPEWMFLADTSHNITAFPIEYTV